MRSFTKGRQAYPPLCRYVCLTAEDCTCQRADKMSFPSVRRIRRSHASVVGAGRAGDGGGGVLGDGVRLCDGASVHGAG